MFTPNSRFGRLVLTLCTAGGLSAAEPAWRPLFNGKDFTGWTAWLGRPHASFDVPGEPKDEKGNYTRPLGATRDPFKVFTITTMDGQPVIRISGQVFGGITTVEEFSNYHLRLQFKWGEKKWPPRDLAPRDSGLLYHVHSAMDFNNRTWPRSPEFQIQEHDVGDLYAIGCQMTVLARRLDPAKRLFQYDPANGTPTEFIGQREADRRVEHPRSHLPRRPEHPHCERQGCHASDQGDPARWRAARAAHRGQDLAPVRGRRGLLPQHRDPADHGRARGIRGEVT
jgi:hypothetical protein